MTSPGKGSTSDDVASASDSNVADEPPPPKRWSRFFGVLCGLIFLLGLLLRLTVRDRLPLLATLFYTLPWPVLSVLALSSWLLMRRTCGHRTARVLAVIALLITSVCCVQMTCWSDREDVDEGLTVRVMFWNTARGAFGWDRVADVINAASPDVAGFVEAGEWSEKRRAFWRESCPGYHVSMLGGGFVCLTREPPGEGDAHKLPDGGRYRQLDVAAGEASLTLLIVDLESNPFVSRADTLRQLAQEADAFGDGPVMLMGDFNTPHDSVHFEPLRVRHTQSFETAGAGYIATWPVPLPMLCLDQIWTNGAIEVRSCRHLWTSASDHRPVMTDVRVLPSRD